MKEIEKLIKENIGISYQEILQGFVGKLVHKRDTIKALKSLLINQLSILNGPLDWEVLCEYGGSLSNAEVFVLYQYFEYLLSEGIYEGKYKLWLVENFEEIKWSKGENLKLIFYKGAKPYYFYVHKRGGSSGVLRSRFNLNCDNDFLRNLMIEFIEQELSEKEVKMTRFKDFIRNFEKSTYALENEINSICDFNIGVFKKQYRYYKHINWHGHKAVTILCRFYMFLSNYMDRKGIKHCIFSSVDEIDYHFLSKNNFSHHYELGYKVVYLNIFDEIPKHDRWMVAPNGEELRTTARKAHEYYPIQFDEIKNNDLKNSFKFWYWTSTKSIYAKDKDYYEIKKFLRFIVNLRSRKSNAIDININSIKQEKKYHISAEDVILYKMKIMSKFDESHTINSIIRAIKGYLQHSFNENVVQIEPIVFNYLRGIAKDEKDKKAITHADFEKIAYALRENKENGGLSDALLFSLFKICSITNLRISEVIGLEVDCLKETMKKGQYIITYKIEEEIDNDCMVSNANGEKIKLIRKGSQGIYVEVSISKLAAEIIKDAINITAWLREEADVSQKKYIFLNRKTKNRIQPIDKDFISKKFKGIIDTLNLEDGPYCLNNLRHTYMTNVYELANKENLGELFIKSATGHLDPRTTIKHYKKDRIAEYLEAFYGVEIGEIETVGQVVEDIHECITDDKKIKYSSVANQGGYCSKSGCVGQHQVDCLICQSFITTIEKISYFEEWIKLIEKDIEKCEVQHEKEHLIKKKILLVAYLERLYICKERIKGNE